jgi:uncharacterized membrane protein YphA (DoxX/SURF4 family)
MIHTLWLVQGLLALIFLFSGAMKLLLPLEAMTEQMPLPLPGLFLRFIGVAEVLGAIGLILPGLLGIRPVLTLLAACGLVVIISVLRRSDVWGPWGRWPVRRWVR